MFEIPVLRATERAWLLDGPLAVFVPAYVARLKCRSHDLIQRATSDQLRYTGRDRP